jgi:hypothetical protein
MADPVSWESVINGNSYRFEYQKVKKDYILTVNGIEKRIKPGFLSQFLLFDERFDLDGIEARLILNRTEPDIVINDVCVRSGKKNVMMPGWAPIFYVLNFAIVVISFGGVISFLLSMLGAVGCVYASKLPLPMIVRLLVCILITVVVWGLWGLMIFTRAAA